MSSTMETMVRSLREEDFRHAWPHALGQMLELYAENMARTEALAAELRELRAALERSGERNLETALSMARNLDHHARDRHGLVEGLSNAFQKHYLELSANAEQRLNQGVAAVAALARECVQHSQSSIRQSTDHSIARLLQHAEYLEKQLAALDATRKTLSLQQTELGRIRRGPWWRRLWWAFTARD